MIRGVPARSEPDVLGGLVGSASSASFMRSLRIFVSFEAENDLTSWDLLVVHAIRLFRAMSSESFLTYVHMKFKHLSTRNFEGMCISVHAGGVM